MSTILLSIVVVNLLAAAVCADGIWREHKRRDVAIHPHVEAPRVSAFDEDDDRHGEKKQDQGCFHRKLPN